jgi:hypothetical protein
MEYVLNFVWWFLSGAGVVGGAGVGFVFAKWLGRTVRDAFGYGDDW